MTRQHALLIVLTAGILLLSLAGCGPSAPQTGLTPEPTAAPVNPGASSGGQGASVTRGELPPPAEPTAQQGAESVPPGWAEVAGEALPVSLYAPPGWELAESDAFNADLREVDGEGWAQIIILEEANAELFGLGYQPSMDAATVLDLLLLAFREDGDFGEVRTIEPLQAQGAAAVEGHYRPYDEQLMLGVAGLPNRAVVVIGHGPEPGESGQEAWARLAPLYEDMLASVGEAD